MLTRCPTMLCVFLNHRHLSLSITHQLFNSLSLSIFNIKREDNLQGGVFILNETTNQSVREDEEKKNEKKIQVHRQSSISTGGDSAGGHGGGCSRHISCRHAIARATRRIDNRQIITVTAQGNRDGNRTHRNRGDEARRIGTLRGI